MNNILWLIDGAYIYRGSKGQFTFNYTRGKRFLEKLLDGGITGAWFNARPMRQTAYQAVLKDLQHSGIMSYLRPTKRETITGQDIVTGLEHTISCKKQGGVDVGLAVEGMALLYEGNFDTLVLSTGDVDLVPLVEKAIGLDKKVYLFAFQENTSRYYQRILGENHIIFIDSVKTQVST